MRDSVPHSTLRLTPYSDHVGCKALTLVVFLWEHMP